MGKINVKPDPEQMKAITSTGNVAVIAGPGAGKTFILTQKAQYESGHHQRIMALTFTRNAAEEIRSRLPKNQSRFRASTIHSLCYQSLGKFPGSYEKLLTNFLELKRPPQFDLVLVDEFQDLTAPELQVILRITKDRIFFVGDNCQAIFGYCDAEGSQISKSDIRKIYIHKNYRSGSAVIKKLERLNLRQLKSVNPDGNDKITGTAILFRTNHHLDLVAKKLQELEYSFVVRKRGFEFPGEIIGVIDANVNNKVNPLELTLSTIHTAKGREWNKVLCFDWGERQIERNLAYVATARASQEYHVVDSLSECLERLNNGG